MPTREATKQPPLHDEFFKEHARKSSGLYLHCCREWDEMVIDSSCKEFEACLCFTKPPAPPSPEGQRADKMKPDPKYKMGQIVIAKSTKKELPFRVLFTIWGEEEGEWFYGWNSKNASAEHMIRKLTPEDCEPSPLPNTPQEERSKIEALKALIQTGYSVAATTLTTDQETVAEAWKWLDAVDKFYEQHPEEKIR